MGFIMEMTDIMEASETEEEQKRIHAFWSDLSDTERQRLAVLDRDVLLKRLKEQQRYTCHCSICDKHTVLSDEECEAIYDAYYNQLLQAAPQSCWSVLTSFQRHGLSDLEEEWARCIAPLPGGGLTLSHQLLMNKGAGFLDIMDRWNAHHRRANSANEKSDAKSAEEPARKALDQEISLIREELQTLVESGRAPRSPHGEKSDEKCPCDHTHPHGDQDSDSDYEDDYEDEDGSYYDDESVTSQSRMDEGRRQLQMIAAKCFEQRVLTAYRERIAAENQERLLRELEEEEEKKEEKENKKRLKKQKEKIKEKLEKEKRKQEEEEALERQRLEAERIAKEAEEAAIKIQMEKERKELERQLKKEEEERMLREAAERKEAERLRKMEKKREKKLAKAKLAEAAALEAASKFEPTKNEQEVAPKTEPEKLKENQKSIENLTPPPSNNSSGHSSNTSSVVPSPLRPIIKQSDDVHQMATHQLRTMLNLDHAALHSPIIGSTSQPVNIPVPVMHPEEYPPAWNRNFSPQEQPFGYPHLMEAPKPYPRPENVYGKSPLAEGFVSQPLYGGVDYAVPPAQDRSNVSNLGFESLLPPAIGIQRAAPPFLPLHHPAALPRTDVVAPIGNQRKSIDPIAYRHNFVAPPKEVTPIMPPTNRKPDNLFNRNGEGLGSLFGSKWGPYTDA